MAVPIVIKADFTSGESVTFRHTVKEKGVAITPETVTWTLIDKDLSIVNGRRNVSATPGIPTLIHLDPGDMTAASGDDLRYLTITSVYKSRVYNDGAESMQFNDGTDWQFNDGDTFELNGGTPRECTSVKQYRFSIRKPVEPVEEAL